ncbi:MAG TPA: hypothetical protein VJG32_22745 [Anaerolineae bacterium]|nr:hypothetical protein [Anaerolineae bacterium]
MSIAEANVNDVWELLHVRRRTPSQPLAAPVDPEPVWNRLQEPAHPGSLDASYRLLRAALDTGWRIEEPIYLRPRWSDSGPRVYHFILRRPRYTTQRLLSVPEGPEVERFVRDEGLRISTPT